MGIRIRHDAAAVALPSTNASGQKYGQQLVLQQQQQKYQGQQAGYDRLLALGRDQQQRVFQGMRDIQQNDWQTQRDLQQNAFQGARDKALMEQREQEQRRADFAAARGRIDTYAKDVLSDPDLPHDLRQRIQNLVSGKMIALGGGFDGPAQQQFLDQYNAQLAAILSEIPPKQPKAPPQPNFHTDENGNKWVESGPGKWEQVPKEQQPPMSFSEYAQREPDKARSALAEKIAAIQQSVDDGLTKLEDGQTVEDLAFSALEQPFQAMRNRYGPPTAAPELPGQAPPPASGPMQSVLEQPTAPASGIPIASPDPGQPPVPRQPPALPSNSSSQNPWAEVAGAEQQSASAPLTSEELKRQGSEVRTMDNGQQTVPAPLSPRVSEPPKIVPPNFDKLAGASTNADERGFLNKIKEVYQGQPPEVQNAISVLINPDSLDRDAAQALSYLNSVGIDITQLAAESPKTIREKVQGKMRAKYGENYDSF